MHQRRSNSLRNCGPTNTQACLDVRLNRCSLVIEQCIQWCQRSNCIRPIVFISKPRIAHVFQLLKRQNLRRHQIREVVECRRIRRLWHKECHVGCARVCLPVKIVPYLRVPLEIFRWLKVLRLFRIVFWEVRYPDALSGPSKRGHPRLVWSRCEIRRQRTAI